jgi:tripartite-type tricarboxylate transporter receptor subunit TctC
MICINAWQLLRAGLVTTLLFALSAPITAQNYPVKPIRFVVPFAAGGATDVMARVFGQKFSETWGQPVVIDNRPGAGGNIGSEAVAKAAPDGYTWLLISSSIASASSLYRKLNYDPVKDLAPISQMTSSALLLVASPALAATSLKELLALARAQPGRINYGSTGVGSSINLVGELLRISAAIDIVHVPYKGDAQIIPALVANEVQIAFLPPQTALAQVKSGKLRALAQTNLARSTSMPDLPTLNEAGVPGFDFPSWIGLFTTGGTPPEVVRRIGDEAGRMLRSPEVAKYFPAWGVEASGTPPEVFSAHFRNEVDKYARIIREAKIPPVD